jgi:subtilisin family serine protease
MRPALAFLPVVLLLAVAGGPPRGAAPGPTTEVVVTLASRPLAGRTDPAASAQVAAEQRAFLQRLHRAVPQAEARWRYRLVANGFAVALPHAAVPRLRALPGVRDVYPSATYTSSLDRSVPQIGAPQLWGPTLAAAGAGVKIGVIDDGLDQSHPFFTPSGYTMPAGYPKGQAAYTTAKVIVARAFAPARPAWKHASKPFDPEESSHATHVAGIAAGNHNTATGGPRISGVAPRAYLGNYKALTIPTDADVGLDGNSPEIVAAIEAAVADGMNVINLSIGEPEVEPSRDVVARALDAAAEAGVVPVVAAGNDYGEFGRGSVSSPGSSARAITVAAVSTSSSGAPNQLAGFSAAGPTPMSLRLKPDVAAPGVRILSSVPGTWALFSGTSMAAPHVAGGAALLLQRHPGWTPEQVKAALVATARPVFESPSVAATPPRGGAGVIDLQRADQPLLLATPVSLSFGLRPPGTATTASVSLADVGTGAGTWSVTVEQSEGPAGLIGVPATVAVPGMLAVSLSVPSAAASGEVSGRIVLTRGTDRRLVPFWLRIAAPALAAAQTTRLTKPGAYRGNTRGRPALAAAYRYPEVLAEGPVSTTLTGPEQVFRVTVPARAANFGVVITGRTRGVRVEPRVIVAGDENRLTGFAALPFYLNPYLVLFGRPVPAAGALSPLPGTYDIVFDSATPAGAGAFTFRYWLNDVTPPTARLVAGSVRRGTPLRVAVVDRGSGIDPATLVVRIDGNAVGARVRSGAVRIATAGLSPGRHRLRLQLSDYQESRNMENVARILPNTRVLSTTFTVR